MADLSTRFGGNPKAARASGIRNDRIIIGCFVLSGLLAAVAGWILAGRMNSAPPLLSQGIVFNAHYLTYFDTAIYEYLRSLPFDYLSHAGDRGEDFHTVKVVVEFHKPCRFDDELDVGVRVVRLGRSSLTFQIGVFLKDGGDARASGQVIWLNADQNPGKSAALPTELVGRVKLLEGQSLHA